MELVFLRAMTHVPGRTIYKEEDLLCLTVSEISIVAALEEEGERRKEVQK